MISVRDARLDVGGRELLRDLSFDVLPGEFVALLGPNGAGKTTLLRTIAGLRGVERGTVTIDGRAATALSSAERARRLAYIAADELFSDRLTVRDVVSSGRYAHHAWWQWRREAHDDDAVDAALRAVGMETFALRLFDTLSSGERQRVWLALALAQESPVLLLDEPTSHLDVRAAHDILGLLRAQVASGKTVVCVLHDLNEAAEYANRALLLGCGGMLAFDRPDCVLSSPELERAYGVAMETVGTASGALRVFPRQR